MTPNELRAAQRLTMANPERLRLVARLLTHPAGRARAEDLARDPSADAEVQQHLEALAAVGLVAVAGPVPSDRPLYRMSARGIARFGAAALAAPRFPGEPALAVHDHKALLARLTETLSTEFAANAGTGTVDRLVRECYSALSRQIDRSGPLTALTAWLAADRLSATTEVTHGSPSDVLFVCVRNTGRSQIAAAVTRRLAGDRVRVRTAGTRPVAEPDPATETVLARRGLDGLIEFPRELTDDIVRASGVIVTMGCGDTCPVYPGRRYLDWPLDDPAGRPIEEVERIVDDITDRVRALLVDIEAADRPAESPVPAGGAAGVPPAWAPGDPVRGTTPHPWSAATAHDAKSRRKAR